MQTDPASAGGFDVHAATEAWLSTVSGAARAASDAYFEGGYWITLWSALIGCVILWALLHFHIASRLARWADSKAGFRPFLASVFFLAPYFVLVAVLLLPWTIYTDFIREHVYGLSNLGFGSWLGEWAMQVAVSTIALTVAVAIILWIVRRTGPAWWGWSAILSSALLVFFIGIAPVVVSPLFNSYTPMPDGIVKQQVLSMARANGVPATNVYVVDQSRQSKRISANVQGLGPTVRVSLNDNLLKQASPAEIRAVMGHELGHYVLNHVWKLLALYVLIILALFGALNWLMPRAIARWGERWRIKDGADPAALPIAGIIVTLFFLLATPITNSISRVTEQEADMFGLNAARAPEGFAEIAMKLSTYRKLDPGQLEEVVFFDHPSGRVRVESAMRWKAEHMGEPGVD
jgi:STE24 endopeptidase